MNNQKYKTSIFSNIDNLFNNSGETDINDIKYKLETILITKTQDKDKNAEVSTPYILFRIL